MFSLPSLHSLECFLLILTFFFCPAVSSQCNLPCNLFTGVESLYQPQIAFFLADKKKNQTTFGSKAFTLSKTPIALKGRGSKALTVRPPQPPPPLSGRMHCAIKMMNDLQRGDRVLLLTAGRWELYRVYIFLQRGDKTRWFSPTSQVTSYISELLKAIAAGSRFTIHPSLLPPNCKSLRKRTRYLLSLPSCSPSLLWVGCAVNGVPESPRCCLHFSFCRQGDQNGEAHRRNEQSPIDFC